MTATVLGLTCLIGAAATSEARVLVDRIWVLCWKHQEVGHDEIYLKFNGVKVHMGSFTTGDQRTSTSTVLLPSFPVNVEFWESDGDHWYDRDDLWDVKNGINAPGKHGSVAVDTWHHYPYEFWLTNVP